MATATYETGQHDGMHATYLDCNRHDFITEEFRAVNALASNRMADTFPLWPMTHFLNFNISKRRWGIQTRS
ncbi:hypothetical protein Hanom_Chr03g00190951 [Helianthus anomalus]